MKETSAGCASEDGVGPPLSADAGDAGVLVHVEEKLLTR